MDEVPVGIIMVKDRREKRCPFRLRLRMLLSVASLFLSKEGRMVTRFFSGVEEIDQQLLQDTQTEYQGEIAFFAVNSRYRGIGLGKKLFDAARDYMRNRRISNFFLFTDTTCNYPFYERRGMERRGGARPHLCGKEKIRDPDHVYLRFLHRMLRQFLSFSPSRVIKCLSRLNDKEVSFTKSRQRILFLTAAGLLIVGGGWFLYSTGFFQAASSQESPAGLH